MCCPRLVAAFVTFFDRFETVYTFTNNPQGEFVRDGTKDRPFAFMTEQKDPIESGSIELRHTSNSESIEVWVGVVIP
jgi:hypothetical protein